MYGHRKQVNKLKQQKSHGLHSPPYVHDAVLPVAFKVLEDKYLQPRRKQDQNLEIMTKARTRAIQGVKRICGIRFNVTSFMENLDQTTLKEKAHYRPQNIIPNISFSFFQSLTHLLTLYFPVPSEKIFFEKSLMILSSCSPGPSSFFYITVISHYRSTFSGNFTNCVSTTLCYFTLPLTFGKLLFCFFLVFIY